MKKILNIFILVVIANSLIFSQLDPDRHTTSPSDGWKSCVESMNPNTDLGMGHWIQFDFLTSQQLTLVKLWNHNDPAHLDDGVSSIRIDYSQDNITWTDGGTYNVAQSDGSSFYQGAIVADLNGANARYLVITALGNHGGTCFGFDETRFYLGASVPVELTSFSGNCENGNKEIAWTFADVSDFASAELEWSRNGIDWERIFTTDNPGDKSAFNSYTSEYTDSRKLTGDNHFYRLKMIDNKELYNYSDIVQVACIVDVNDVRIYPQPVSAEMSLDIELIEDMNIKYQIKNVLGQNIASGNFEANSGLNRFNIGTDDYLPGQYFIILEMNGTQLEKKFIKQ